MTGGSDGIGWGIAAAFAAEGASVWLVARRPDQLAASHDAVARAASSAGRGRALGRLGTVEDVAAAAVYLASAEAKWVTGTVLIVDGGLSTN